MAKALDVAWYLIRRAAAEEESERLTHLRLQKLLYYAQGWSLALRKKALFDERIEAWAHGPVVKDLYPVFQQFKYESIPPSFAEEPDTLTSEDEQLVEAVWETFKDYSAISLREMTHSEPPWKDARGDAEPGERCDNEITQEAMMKYFSSVSENK